MPYRHALESRGSRICLRSTLTSDAPDATYTLIQRVLTALIHYVKHTEQYSPVADLLVRQFASISISADHSSSQDIERLKHILDIIVIPSTVRQGSRLTRMWALCFYFMKLEIGRAHV